MPCRLLRLLFRLLVPPLTAAMLLALPGCNRVSNNPHPRGSERSNTLFVPFLARSPKYLDPASSYSNDETPFTYQVYEPLYAYHFLKRPYTLIGNAATEVARPVYLDTAGQALPEDAPGAQVAQTVLDIPLKHGILFAPHPAFARDAQGHYLYHHLRAQDVADKNKISDFAATGTRELVADDYVYAIRRLATPRVKSPGFSTMADYIVGLKEYGERIAAVDRALRKNIDATNRDLPLLDFRNYPLEGVQALDKYTLRIRLIGKYPQFKYWLAMTFFAPVPWEAEVFYAQPGMVARNLTLNYWPVGTGPYMLTDYVENRRHVLQRNPNYRGESYPCEGEPGDREKGWLDDCGKTMPFVDRIVFDIEKESVPLQAKFLQGYYDTPAIERLDRGTELIVDMGDSADKAREYREKGLRLPTTIEATNWYIGFNWLDPVLGGGGTPEQAERKRKLRQAISIALDWEEYVAIFEKGQGVAAHGPLPPSLFGYRADGPAAFDPVVYVRDANGKPQRRPLADAKQLLAEAGYPFQLSGGQKQRVMVAMALAAKPDVLIADEPTTALDVTIQAQILDLLKELQASLKMAVLLITHDLAVVSQMAQHVALMYAGQIIETASAQDFFSRPLHPYAVALFAALPDQRQRGQALQSIGGAVPALDQTFTACRFADRCPYAHAACYAQPPALVEQGAGHAVRCVLYLNSATVYAAPAAAASAMPGGATLQSNAPGQVPVQADGAAGSVATATATATAAAAAAAGAGAGAGAQTKLPGLLLEVRDLRVGFPMRRGLLQRTHGHAQAVDGVSFQLAAGRTLALVGESGSGKTTVAKALLQLLRGVARVEGAVLLDGQSLNSLRGEALRLARRSAQIVFQDPFSSLNPRMRVNDILQEGVAALCPELDADQRDQRVRSLLERVGLRLDALERYPHAFSGGQRQRLAIARALAVQPRLIVADEPTSALDVSVQAQILNLLRDLQQDMGLSYLLITHNFSVVAYLADDVAVMQNGKIVEAGPVATVLGNPQHRYTQSLLAAVPQLALPLR